MTKKTLGSYLVIGLFTTLVFSESALSQDPGGTGPASQASIGPGIAAIEEATCYVLAFATGSFGALLVAVAGVGAVVAAALGDMRKAINALIISVCAWAIEPTASFFFLNSEASNGNSTNYHQLDCNARGVVLPRPGRN